MDLLPLSRGLIGIEMKGEHEKNRTEERHQCLQNEVFQTLENM